MRDKRKSTLKILDFLERNMPIDDEEIERPKKPAPLTESNAGENDVDKRLVQGSSKRINTDDKSDSPIDPIVIPTMMGNKHRKKKLIDDLLS